MSKAAGQDSNSNFVTTTLVLGQGPTIDTNKAQPISHRKQRKPRDMDPDYGREYFRPRGEFLTRGAALASAQIVGPDYGAGTPVGSARGSLASHLDTIGVSSSGQNIVTANGNVIYSVSQRAPPPSAANGDQMVDRRYVAVASSAAASAAINNVSVSRLQAAGGKEKYGERRNPTILRKSMYRECAKLICYSI